jgi:hypothetical protein
MKMMSDSVFIPLHEPIRFQVTFQLPLIVATGNEVEVIKPVAEIPSWDDSRIKDNAIEIVLRLSRSSSHRRVNGD